MRRRSKFVLLLTAAGIVAALPALAQDRPESILPEGFGETPAAPATGNASAPSRPAGPSEGSAVVEASAAEVAAALQEQQQQQVVQIELPAGSRRDASVAGPLPPGTSGFGSDLWGGSSGKFLSILMRRARAPIASRWGQIMLRNALLTGGNAPSDVHPGDWAAERAWLLLRMGEADAARLLVASVDVGDFTPKMFQVATQVGLANADPAALCPIRDGIAKYDKGVAPLVRAMCASLSGNSAEAAADIQAARRRGRYEDIDLALADKVVGAGADSARSVTLEWEPVNEVGIWRFGLATATGITLPERLMTGRPARMLAWQARAPMLQPRDRIAGARIAAALGVFSSQALIDLYAQVYDATDPDTLATTDAWQLRQAMVGDTQEQRLAAIAKLLDGNGNPLQEEAGRALVARAASLVTPSAELEEEAPELIAAMLTAGNIEGLARWGAVLGDMSSKSRATCWGMMALALPGLQVASNELDNFIDEDESEGRYRSALLVAGLAGLGKISPQQAGSLSSQLGIGLGRKNVYTDHLDGASLRRQAGTVAVLSAVGMQATRWKDVPPLHLYHLTTGLRRNGLDLYARMIAAEALART